MCVQEQDAAGPRVRQGGGVPDQAAAPVQATKREAQQGGAGEADDLDCVIVEDGGAAEGYNGFYRAARETGRANILLALQVYCCPDFQALFGVPLYMRLSKETPMTR